MKKVGGIQALALASTLLAGSALAATSSTATTSGTTSAEASEAAPKLIDKLSIAYAGQYVGPSIGNPSAYITDEYGLTTDTKQVIDSVLATGYKLNDRMSAGLNINFVYTPVMGQDLRLKDPTLKLSMKKLIDRGNLSLNGDFRIYPGVTASSRNKSMLAGVRTTQSLNYTVPNSKFSVGAAGIIRWNIYGASASSGQDISTYLGPNVNYQISPTVAANLLYEMGGGHSLGESITNWSADGTDLQAGVSWDITKAINLNPYLQLTPGGKVNLDSTSFGAYITAKLL